MKKLARLTALLLTGALLLVLTACGAAPLAKEQQAKQQILTAINQYRTSNGAKAVDEIPELSKAEQFWVDAFRKEGDYKVLLIKTDLVYDDYDKMIPAEWGLFQSEPEPMKVKPSFILVHSHITLYHCTLRVGL